MSMRKIVECRDVCKTYLQGKIEIPALKNVNFTVCEGDYTAIIGPSGSGKSTLMNLIGCLDTPTSGSLRIDGREIETLSANELADLFALSGGDGGGDLSDSHAALHDASKADQEPLFPEPHVLSSLCHPGRHDDPRHLLFHGEYVDGRRGNGGRLRACLL